jgi:hypothetical protein
MNLKNTQTDNLLFLAESLIKQVGEFTAGALARPFGVASKLAGQSPNVSWKQIISHHPYSSNVHSNAQKLGLLSHDAALVGATGAGIGKLATEPSKQPIFVDPNTNTELTPHNHDIQSTLLGASIGGLGAYGAYRIMKGKRNDSR